MNPTAQRTALRTLVLLSLSLVLVFPSPALAEDSLIAINAWGHYYQPNYLLKIDPWSGEILARRDLTIEETQFWGGFGLATHPSTGALYGVVERYGDDVRILVTIDPVTGTATPVGETGETGLYIVGLSFAADGTLYAVTGRASSSEPADRNALFTLDITSDPIGKTKVCDLVDRYSTRSIAFHPDDGLLYHASGGNSTPQVFESIDVATPETSCPEPAAISLTGDYLDDQIISISYLGSNTFLAALRSGGLYTITASGLVDEISTLDPDSVKGMAWTSATLPLRDVDVSTSFSPTSVLSGGSTTLTVTITNNEAGDAAGVRTTMWRGTNFTLTGQSGDATCSETTSPPLIICDFGTLAGSTSESVALQLTATYTWSTNAWASNSVRTDEWISSPSWQSSSYVTFLGSDLALSAKPPKQAAQKGKESTFTFTAHNLGPSDTGAVKLEVWTEIGSGTYVGASGASCTQDSWGSVICDLGTLLNGQSKSASITYLCNVPGKSTFGLGGALWSEAGPDPDRDNNHAYPSVKTVGKP